MRVSYVEHVPNEEVLRRVCQDRGLLGQVKSRKLKYFGQTTRHQSLEKKHHARHHARKTSASYRSVGREKPGRNGKTGGEQRRLPVLSS